MSTTEKRDKLNLTKEEAQGLIGGYGPKNIEVISDDICDHRRWSVDHRIVIKDKETGKYYCDYYSDGATEYQDERAWDYSEPNFTEVFPVKKTITIYE